MTDRDLTGLCERIAARLADAGVTHPVAAAVALSARGHLGLDADVFANRYGIDPSRLRRLEAGAVAWEDLPDCIGAVLDDIDGFDLLALADLDATLRRDRPTGTDG